MDKKRFAQMFARRLAALMQQEGHGVGRSKAGVDIQMLAKITECSYQMARKYAMGEVLPELHIILKIAEYYKASPSWLLFGEDDFSALRPKNSKDLVEIDQKLLRYILEKCLLILPLATSKEEALDFIVETIYDASHLNTDAKTIYKIIDMIVSSAGLIAKNKMDKVVP